MTSLFNLKADLEAALPDIAQPQHDVPTSKNREAKKLKPRSSPKPKTYGGIKKAQKKKQDKQVRRFNQPPQRLMSPSTLIETLEVALPDGFTHPDDNTIANIITGTVASIISSTLRLHGQLLIDVPRIHAFAQALFVAIDYEAEVFDAMDCPGEDPRGKYFSEVAQIIRRDGMHQYFVTARNLYLKNHGPVDSGFSSFTSKTRFLIKLVDRYMSRIAYEN
ncbi:hypothetical protein K4K59_012828 [Colletotrichum sp. SAR11_240]|nr:hypothetical protein K4K59_012828 [Colletotrichum sp. SAR11_240]